LLDFIKESSTEAISLTEDSKIKASREKKVFTNINN